jgi:hypothetical protein
MLAYQPCAPESKVGGFTVELASDYTSVEGKVFDGIEPIEALAEVAREGDCRLVTPPLLLCDPACLPSETCGLGSQCGPERRSHDVGTVTVQGLLIPLQMTPNAATKNYTKPATPALPHPGFESGADLRVTTSGGDYAPFELRGWGISLLEITTDPIRVAEGSATTLAWQVPPEVGPARVRVTLEVNIHGANTAAIECVFPDTGAAEIPASLIDGLIAQGLSGDPTITVTRQTAHSVAIEPGCVELLVTSDLTGIPVEVEGLISCDDDSMCPAGQTCVPVERFCQ